ncbi:hypothetical protein HU200_034758 [Digitaria exilis]|uniref:Uncharacterized protein n=1 Tax=Digitaria exilis TaxID=1010633 RepID=A0A835ELV1_9POAL|nr:hypothetical protein HU200_034758 [Digitaria exilis]
MEAAEFWGLLYSGSQQMRNLPRVKPAYPLVSLVDPDVILFLLEEDHDTYWIVEVDMRNMVLRSCARYMNEEDEEGCVAERVRRNVFDGHSFFPSEISSYLL